MKLELTISLNICDFSVLIEKNFRAPENNPNNHYYSFIYQDNYIMFTPKLLFQPHKMINPILNKSLFFPQKIKKRTQETTPSQMYLKYFFLYFPQTLIL